ncbi:MAG: hypothetical protein CW335_02725 [Clostridiales bacterium]|nr:hypothetical protein [Clostridiales bacterium]
MQNNSQFSAQQMSKLLASPEGRQLIALLQRDSGKNMQQAAAEFQKGNVAAAQELLKPVMQSQEASDLLQKINGK